MAVETVTYDVCDRCKSRRQRGLPKANTWGEMEVTWSGRTGGRSVMGDAGGLTHTGKWWLCESCTEDFLYFLNSPKVVAV